METNFNFKSQICTDKVQSERLLALGLKKETSDMMHYAYIYTAGGCFIEEHLRNYHIRTKKDNIWVEISNEHRIPAWSLHRLIEMMPEEMYGGLLCIFKDSIRYEEVIMDRLEAHFEVVGYDMYDNAISCIEWLIKEGCFNKEYLV